MGEQLRRLLVDLEGAYARLERLGGERDEAVGGADVKALAERLAEEGRVVDEIVSMDRRRAGVVGYFARLLEPRDPSELTARSIADALEDESLAQAIRDAAEALRERIEAVKKSNESARLSAETLAAHMQGLLRSAAERLSHSGTYGRAGAVEAGPTVMSAVDLTS